MESLNSGYVVTVLTPRASATPRACKGSGTPALHPLSALVSEALKPYSGQRQFPVLLGPGHHFWVSEDLMWYCSVTEPSGDVTYCASCHSEFRATGVLC